jgi:hypothetical protein
MLRGLTGPDPGPRADAMYASTPGSLNNTVLGVRALNNRMMLKIVVVVDYQPTLSAAQSADVRAVSAEYRLSPPSSY